jgi:hypothetical protein
MLNPLGKKWNISLGDVDVSGWLSLAAKFV